MKVYNLTNAAIVYRGRSIPPKGSIDLPLRFVTDRDKKLADNGLLSFGKAPALDRPKARLNKPKLVPPPAPVAEAPKEEEKKKSKKAKTDEIKVAIEGSRKRLESHLEKIEKTQTTSSSLLPTFKDTKEDDPKK